MARAVLFCTLLVLLPAYVELCNLPPLVWCSSREVARQCNVEQQCESFLTPGNINQAPRVNFTLYMESLCPFCAYFITDQLYPTFKSIGSIMNLAIVPYGNANEKHVGDKWQFSCQHGKEECYGNLLETCAIHYHPNVSDYFPFIHCIEAQTSASTTPRQSAPGCAEKFGLDYSKIKSCADGPLGNSLEHKMAVETNSLHPSHKYVPWVTLNGVHTKKIQKEAQNDLKTLICETYQGRPKPKECAKDVKVSKVEKHNMIGIIN